MNEALRKSAAHVFIEDLQHPRIAEEDLHHLRKVLRIRPGETITICDGRGSWRTATLAGSELEPNGATNTELPLAPTRLAFVPVKGDKPELVVQKATEIGVGEIIVVAPTHRSVVRWDERKVVSEMKRLNRIAREASMQSRRVFVPSVTGPMELSALAQSGFAVAEPGGTAVNATSIVIGPEGGFDDSELALFAERVDLGGTILRAETAAIVASARIVASVNA